MKFQNKELILFDLDGTLIDSVPDLAYSVNETLKVLKKDIFDTSIIRTWVGNGAATLINRALSSSVTIKNTLDENLKKEALEIFLHIYSKNLCVNTIMFDGVKATLESLKKQGYTLAIVTNKPFDFVEPILKTLGIDELFSFVLGGDSLEVKKPNPAPLLFVCEKLGFSVESSIMIGDSKNDILAANNCKMHSIALTYGYNYDEDISVHNPSLVYDKFEEILKSL